MGILLVLGFLGRWMVQRRGFGVAGVFRLAGWVEGSGGCGVVVGIVSTRLKWGIWGLGFEAGVSGLRRRELGWTCSSERSLEILH